MRLGGRVPGQLVARPPRALAGLVERLVVGEELTEGVREAGDVACGHDAPGPEPAHGLGNASDVVGDDRNSCAERAQQSAALIELGPVWEQRDGGIAEGAVDLGLREIAEPPLDLESVRGGAIGLDGLQRVARHEQPCVPGAAHCLDRVAESLVRADDPEGEHGPAVVLPLGLTREHGVWDDPEPFGIDAELGERLPAVLAVHDDPVEARKEPAPQVGAVRGAAGQQVVGGEDRRQMGSEEERVEFWSRQPLEVQNIRLQPAERGESERMLRNLDWYAQPRTTEDPRRKGIEELAAAISLRFRHRAEAKARGHELDLRTRAGQRRSELVVVRRREGRRIGEQDAHGLVRYAVAMLARTWNLFHGNACPPERRAFLREMIELVTRDRPDIVCLQELPVWALDHLERWSGMHATGAVARQPLLPFGARQVTALHHGLLRSAVTGEADAILTRDPVHDVAVHVVGEDKLRRIAQAADVEGVTVVNFHIDGDRRQFDRVVALARERSILAGDANLVAPRADGFSPPLAGSIDQILVCGLELRDGPSAWPLERRIVDGRLLSDHAPVEAVVE